MKEFLGVVGSLLVVAGFLGSAAAGYAVFLDLQWLHRSASTPTDMTWRFIAYDLSALAVCLLGFGTGAIWASQEGSKDAEKVKSVG